jgi:hypothetical protein
MVVALSRCLPNFLGLLSKSMITYLMPLARESEVKAKDIDTIRVKFVTTTVCYVERKSEMKDK